MKYKTQLIIAAILLLSFIVIILYEHFGPSKYTVLDFHHKVPLTTVERHVMRGTVYINDTLVVGSDILLAEKKSNTNRLDKRNSISQNKEYKTEISSRLGSLAPPYQVFKKKNNDTLVVIKDKTDTLKYLLSYTIDDLYPQDTLTVNDLLRSILTPEKDEKK